MDDTIDIAQIDPRQKDSEDMEHVFRQMSMISEIDNTFKVMMSRDMNMYFSAVSDKERDMIKGAYLRMHYLLEQMKKARLTSEK